MSNELNDIKLSIEDHANNISYGEDKFLFFFEPKNLDNECVGGISLVNGVRIFAGISLIQALNSCMEIFQTTLWMEKFGYILLTLVFLTICLCAFFSTLSENMTFAKIAYWVSAAAFLLAAIKYICKSFLKIIEFINPWDGDFLQLDFLVYVFGRGFYLFLYLYLIWILYCYMANHAKNN